MNRKVTIQDIADALGISRNTVSKAINNSDGIADATRERIIQKAVEMGYKQFSYVSSVLGMKQEEETQKKTIPGSAGEIALFTPSYLPNSHFASLFLDRVYEEIARMGYTLIVHRVSIENCAKKKLPKSFHAEKAKGILCVEIFDADYSDMLCALGLPILFVDGPCRKGLRSVQADMLMMDNTTEICRFIKDKIELGLTRIGFIGDYDHCESFGERYVAYRMSMIAAGIPVQEKFIINTPNRDYDALGDALDALDEMPDIFICANDFVAIDAMQLLAQKDRKLLKKIRFLGFDDSHESRIFYPALSTVHIHSQAMAFSALHLLMTRIKEPSMDFRTIYVATDLVLRDSTEF